MDEKLVCAKLSWASARDFRMKLEPPRFDAYQCICVRVCRYMFRGAGVAIIQLRTNASSQERKSS